jgi:putative transposase
VATPPNYHKHPRLPGHSYTDGSYFVTLCTRDGGHWYGRVIGSGASAVFEPNDAGRIVLQDLQALPQHFPHVRLDEVQLMPDHLHFVITIKGDGSTRPSTPLRVGVDGAGADSEVSASPQSARPRGPKPGSLGAIIAAFKSGSTIKMNRLRGTPGQKYWQLGYP